MEQTMKYFFIIFGLFLMSGCKSKQDVVVVTFPMYKECNEVLSKVEGHLNRPGKGYSIDVTVKDYDVSPEYGNYSTGLGSLTLTGGIELLDGSSAEDYLKSHISSMFHDCMPNNAVQIGDSNMARELSYKLRSNHVSGYIKDNKFWVLVNDGSYQYMERR